MQTFFDVILIISLGVVLWWGWRARRENTQLRTALAKNSETAEQLAAEQRRIDGRITAMIDAPPHALLVLDQNSVVLRANYRAAELLGSQLIGKTVIEATRSHEIDSVVQQTLSAQQIEERPVTWNARPYFARVVPIGDGGAVLALEDQSDRLRSDRMRRDFVANISHELRTPLASIRLLIETLLAGAKDEPEVATRMLNQMLGEIDSITQLAQELLDLSLIEAGQMPMQIARADLGEIAAEQIIHYEPMAQQKQIVVTNDVAEDVIVEVDAKLIGRVLGNLIQRDQVHTRSGPHHHRGGPGRRPDQSECLRYGQRYPSRRFATHLRTIL